MIGSRLTSAVLVCLSTALPSAMATQRTTFAPPELASAEVPPLPPSTTAGGGEVSVEILVDATGAVTRPVVLRGTPPYTSIVLDAVSRWRFEPARRRDEKGTLTAVEMPVTVTAIYRAPVLGHGPGAGEPPRDLGTPSADVALPIAVQVPAHPPLALEGGVVLVEARLDATGAVIDVGLTASRSGFDEVARAALSHWRFRPASYRGEQVPGTAYVVFGFPQPVTLPRP